MSAMREFILGERHDLPASYEEKLAKLRTIRGLQARYPKETCITMIMSELGVELSWAYNLYRSAIELFGDINEETRRGELWIRYEALVRQAAVAEEKGDLKEAIAANNHAAKLLLEMGSLTDKGSSGSKVIDVNFSDVMEAEDTEAEEVTDGDE